MNENEIASIIVNASLEIHKAPGPGLLESVYEQVLAGKLKKEGLQVEVQKKISIIWKNRYCKPGYRDEDNYII